MTKLREYRKQANLTQAELADRAGTTAPQINRLETGARRMTIEWAEKLAPVLNIDPQELLFDRPSKVQPPKQAVQSSSQKSTEQGVREFSPAAFAPIDRLTMPLDVPVLGVAVGGNGGDFRMNGEVIDYARRPPGLAKTTNAFALYVENFSMSPRFEQGELIYINPHRPPMIGDYVVIELLQKANGDNGDGYIKRLVKKTATKTVVEQFNPPKQIELDNDIIKFMYRVIPWNELLGI